MGATIATLVQPQLKTVPITLAQVLAKLGSKPFTPNAIEMYKRRKREEAVKRLAAAGINILGTAWMPGDWLNASRLPGDVPAHGFALAGSIAQEFPGAEFMVERLQEDPLIHVRDRNKPGEHFTIYGFDEGVELIEIEGELTEMPMLE